MIISYNDLKICAQLLNKARDTQERIDRLRAQLERCTPHLSHTGDRHTNVSMDKNAEGIQKLLDMESACSMQITAYLEHVQIVTEAIEQGVKDITQQRILMLRFVDGLKWDEICARTFYEDKWCRILCNRGLSAMGIKKPRKRKRVQRVPQSTDSDVVK